MHGDFSRWTHDFSRRYRRVLQQQGRVLLDSDWNALNALLVDEIRVLASDLIGAHGGPETHCGFRVVVDPETLPDSDPDKAGFIALRDADGEDASGDRDFYIGSGHYWVDGLLCIAKRRTTYRMQPDRPPYPENDSRESLSDVARGGYLIYLEAWERHLTASDDPSIREVALLGPDTCARTRLVWQVKVEPRDDLGDIFGAPDEATKQSRALDVADRWLAERTYPTPPMRRPLTPVPTPVPTPLLRAWVSEGPVSDDPCILPAEARYRGRENQLYRVEIHRGGDNIEDVTFKWSRDNGSVTFPIVRLEGTTATVEHLGRDARSTLSPGDMVEILDDVVVLHGDTLPLARVQAVDREESIVTLEVSAGASLPVYNEQSTAHPFLRRWDHRGDPEKYGGALRVAQATVEKGFPLEAGIMVRFASPSEAGSPPAYRTGNYWWIPARAATGDIEWPRDGLNGAGEPADLPPSGIERRYAPLCFLQEGETLDLRRMFAGLASERF